MNIRTSYYEEKNETYAEVYAKAAVAVISVIAGVLGIIGIAVFFLTI